MFKIACIPAYNEEKMISILIKRSLPHVDEVVICDDGSTDRTSTVAKLAGAHVINHKNNLGKGAALKSLFDYARKKNVDAMVTIDSDGQFLPEEIPILFQPILEEKVDVVVGNRSNKKHVMPSYRKIGNEFLDKMTQLASNLPINDTQSGFRAYSKNAISLIEFSTKGFGADSEILVNAAKKNLKFAEKKVTVIYNTGVETSTKNPVSHTAEVVTSLLEVIALKHPLSYVGVPGIILLIVGIIFSIIVITIFNEIRYFSVPSTLLALGFTLGGLLLLLMSIILFGISRIGKLK